MTSADQNTPLTDRQLSELLRGTVSYVGRLDRLTHDEFVEAVERHGGQYLRYTHHAEIGLIVVGAADLPITSTGDPIDFHGRCAVGESQFLALAGVDHGQQPVGGYSVQALAELLGVPPRRVTAWYKAGLIRPHSSRHGILQFDFRQASVARTLVNLHDAGVTIPRLRQSLLSLQRCLPQIEEPLEQLASLERHDALLWRLESGELAGVDGQLWIDFDHADDDGPQPIRLHTEQPAMSGQQWHAQGIEQEQLGFMAEAEQSYRRALEVGGPDEQVNFDLAYLLARRGETETAIERYAIVLEMNPGRTDAWNNLGILLADAGRTDDAIAAFRRVVTLSPNDAEAHYNLADALREAGLKSQAAEHFRTFLRLDRTASPWTAHAREHV